MKKARLVPGAVALLLTSLFIHAHAQTLRPENDPRNVTPTVGTGGAVSGPTGLFTIIDAQTLREKENTSSSAYSSYHRDPGDASITDIPFSVSVGLSDHFEVFFNKVPYRGIRVNRPQNLSSFYLPNSQLFFGTALRSGAAIVLAPVNNAGVTGAVFRPVGNQPFVQFPFVGGSAGSFQNGFAGTNARFNFTLGAPSSGGSRFGAAANFPGIGSAFGSILPGVVLSTALRPASGGAAAITVPATFTVAPAYLPDAPFINRLYGQSSFGTFTVGAKYRISAPDARFGVALVPFYRFHPDTAGDADGFNQLQRGASPGGGLGDFGLIFAADGRLSRSVNLSANLGYVINSNPRSGAFGGGEVTLLDRPNEIIAGLAFDFPVSKFFQPIAELRSTQYAGSRTPNAFGNNPVEVIAGFRVFLARGAGLGFAYRHHLNYQGRGRFAAAPPAGFLPSEGGSGFIVQLWGGKRNARENCPPELEPAFPLKEEDALILPCPPGYLPQGGACPVPEPFSALVKVGGMVTDAEGDPVRISWNDPAPTAGRIVGEGEHVMWDLTGVGPGSYVATETLTDSRGGVTKHEFKITIKGCAACCPTVLVPDPAPVAAGATVTFTANVSAADADRLPYSWVVPQGRIVSGQGTRSIVVDTTGLGGQTVTATVTVGDLSPTCAATATGRARVLPSAPCPAINIAGPAGGNVEAGKPIEFAATLSDHAPNVTPTFDWSVSAGTIVRGQGTPSIVVEPPSDGTETVVASVRVGGFDADCVQQSPPVRILKVFDRYGYICFNNEKARLDNFAIALSGDPQAQGFIIAYTGRLSTQQDARERVNRAKEYVTGTRGIPAHRINVKVVEGGSSEYLRGELWLRPLGAREPPIDLSNPQLIPGLDEIKPEQERVECGPRRKRGKKRVSWRRPGKRSAVPKRRALGS